MIKRGSSTSITWLITSPRVMPVRRTLETAMRVAMVLHRMGATPRTASGTPDIRDDI